jgi:uncharacterized membrane protein YgcG
VKIGVDAQAAFVTPKIEHTQNYFVALSFFTFILCRFITRKQAEARTRGRRGRYAESGGGGGNGDGARGGGGDEGVNCDNYESSR